VKRINRVEKGIVSLILVIVFLYSHSVSAEIRSSAQPPDTWSDPLIQKDKRVKDIAKNSYRGEYIYSSVLVELL
jgi:hypothetical protein